MLATLQDAVNHVAANAAKGVNDPRVVSVINEAQRRLIVKGEWKNTVRQMIIATQNNTLTCPREVEKILMVDINGTPARIMPSAYQFLECGPGELDTCANQWCELLGVVPGLYPTYFDPPSDTPRKIMALSTSADDIGKKVVIQGYTTLNNEVRVGAAPGEELAIGYWCNGVEGQLDKAAWPDLTENEYLQVTAVQKEVTKGYIALYVYNESDTLAEQRMWFLSKLHPNETNPGYQRYRIMNMRLPKEALDSTGNYLIKLTCLVKMAYVPAVHANDVLVINNLDAIKNMVKAIGFENSNDPKNRDSYEATALRLLEEQLSGSRSGQILLNVDVGDHGVGDGPNMV